MEINFDKLSQFFLGDSSQKETKRLLKKESTKADYFTTREIEKRQSERLKDLWHNPNTRLRMLENVTYKRCKPILQLSMDGIVIARYSSIREAGRQTRTPPSNITNVLKGKRNKAGGYRWQYE